MSYIRCPTCRELLGNKILLFNDQTTKINNLDIPEKEKEKLRKDLINNLLELYCCKQRLITIVDTVSLIK